MADVDCDSRNNDGPGRMSVEDVRGRVQKEEILP